MNQDKEIKITLNLKKKNKKEETPKSQIELPLKEKEALLQEKQEKKVAKLDLDRLVEEDRKREIQEEQRRQAKAIQEQEKKKSIVSKNVRKDDHEVSKKKESFKPKVQKSTHVKIEKKKKAPTEIKKEEKEAKVTKKVKQKPVKTVEQDLDDVVELLKEHQEKMVEQRAPRIGKTQLEVKKELEEKREEAKQKSISLKKMITSIFVILFIILGYLFFEYAPIIGIRLPTNRDKEVKIDMVSTDHDIYDTYNNELLVYSNHTISTYNKQGEKTWEHSLDTSFHPNIYIYDRYMVVSNNASGLIYLFHQKNEIRNMKVDGKIESIYMDQEGNMAVEYSTNSYKKIIGVYNEKGKNLYNTYLEYATIVDIKLLDHAKKLMITQASSNSFKIGCKISILDGMSEEKKQEELLKFDNNFIFDIKQIKQDLVILLDNKIVKYHFNTKEQKVIKEYESSQVLFVSILEDYYMVVEKMLNDEEKYTITSCDFENRCISTSNLESAPKAMVGSKYLNYCMYQNKLQVFNKWGIEVLTKELKMIPKDIIVFNSNKSAALIYTNRIELISL